MGFLMCRDLPFYQLNWKWETILNNEDIKGDIKIQMTERAMEGFLKAKDVMKVIAGPKMQARFT